MVRWPERYGVWLLLGAMTVLLAMLAALQYHWTGEIGRAEADRQRTRLERASQRFARELGHEVGQAMSAFARPDRPRDGDSEPFGESRHEPCTDIGSVRCSGVGRVVEQHGGRAVPDHGAEKIGSDSGDVRESMDQHDPARQHCARVGCNQVRRAPQQGRGAPSPEQLRALGDP